MSPPNDATRDKLKEPIPIIRNTRAAVTVIEGKGFGAAIIRGLVSWFALFSKSTVPHEVHSTAREGIEFLLRHRDPKHLQLGIDDVMRTYDRLLRG